MLAALVHRGPMTDFDNHDDELVVADLVDNSVDPLSNPIPLQGRKLYATLSAWIITQCLNPLQNTSNILFWDAP